MKQKMQGFTLLELVVVVALLGMIASLATDFTIFNNNQNRFDITKTKLDSIHQAILGVPGSTVNGEVVISGFVADTGEVPRHLIALVVGGYCLNPKFLRNAADCETNNSGDWQTYANWDGPYLQALDLVEGRFNSSDISYQVFRDGWGNSAQQWLNMTADEEQQEDVLNFGWWVNVSGNDITVRSVGLNGLVDPGFDNTVLPTGDVLEASTANNTTFDGLAEHERDYPNTVYVNNSAASPPDFILELINIVNDPEVEDILELQGFMSDVVSLRVVNINATTLNDDYCLVINNGSNTYISGNTSLNLETNQPEVFSFSNFINDIGGASVSPVPKGNYTYQLYDTCPAYGTAPVTDPSFKLYIKSNGDFATLYEFI